MDTQTVSNHTSRSKKKKAAVVGTASRVAKKVEHEFESGVGEFLHDGRAKIEQATSGATSFVTRNPKTSVGVALGVGLIIGTLVDGRVAEMAAGSIGSLVKLARKRLR